MTVVPSRAELDTWDVVRWIAAIRSSLEGRHPITGRQVHPEDPLRELRSLLQGAPGTAARANHLAAVLDLLDQPPPKDLRRLLDHMQATATAVERDLLAHAQHLERRLMGMVTAVDGEEAHAALKTLAALDLPRYDDGFWHRQAGGLDPFVALEVIARRSASAGYPNDQPALEALRACLGDCASRGADAVSDLAMVLQGLRDDGHQMERVVKWLAQAQEDSTTKIAGEASSMIGLSTGETVDRDSFFGTRRHLFGAFPQ